MGSVVTEADVVRLVGAVEPFLMREFLRTGASPGELRRAVAIVATDGGAGRSLSPRLRRLVDLIGVVDAGLARGTAA